MATRARGRLLQRPEGEPEGGGRPPFTMYVTNEYNGHADFNEHNMQLQESPEPSTGNLVIFFPRPVLFRGRSLIWEWGGGEAALK